MTDIKNKHHLFSHEKASSGENCKYTKLMEVFKNEVKNISPQMEKAIAKMSATRTPEGLHEAKNDLLIGCFQNAAKIREVVLTALDLTHSLIKDNETKVDAPYDQPLAIYQAMQQEENLFSVHRLIQSSSLPDLNCFIALRLAVLNHNISFIHSVLFPEGSGRLSHLKIDSRNRINVTLQFAIEKGDIEIVTHILSKLPIQNRGLFFSIALYEAALAKNEIMVSMLFSHKDFLKIEDEAISHSKIMSQKMGTDHIVHSLLAG